MPPHDRRRHVAVLVVAALVAAAGLAALAGRPAPTPERIAQLPPELQATLRQRQARFDALDATQRQALRQRARAWDALPLAERRARRERWEAWQDLPPVEQARLRAAWRRFQALPPARRDALRARFQALDGSVRHGWLLGPVLGADYPALQPLLLQVPATEREGLLAALRGMSAGERADLAVLAHRTPPTARDALRRGLLAEPADARGAWLRAQLRR